jgi:dihydroorotate dehydrogenase electron transfer subunit
MNCSPHHDAKRSSVSRRFLTVPLVRRDNVGAEYQILTFAVPDGLHALPGQFVMVRGASWGEAPLLARPMSVLSAGSEPSILIRVVGEGTRRMARAVPGELFTVLGPLGNGWRAPPPGRRPLLVGGGVGIAPLLFWARSLTEQGLHPVGIYAARTDRHLPLADEFGEVTQMWITTEDGSKGQHGLATDALETRLEPDMTVYTCGPEPMMARVAQICAAHDIPCEVSLEAPMACGIGVCLGCAVPTTDGGFLYACDEGPCVDATRIDWLRSSSGQAAHRAAGAGCD